ncbi:MAG: pyruvate kinase [Silvanigrellaceae bacterium]|nr:pyruvate kinase [Silvanigrellaceae bacterium]
MTDWDPLSKTKIVCTLGPSSNSREVIAALIDNGMNVVRLNFSHGDHSIHAENINLVREVSKEKNKQIAILQDLQGPKIRVGKLKNNALFLKEGQIVTLRHAIEQTDETIPIDYSDLINDVSVGSNILLDDGLLSMHIIELKGRDVICKVTHGGTLKSRKGVNFPDCNLSIPATTEKDIRDLFFGISHNVDYVALSFVQKAEDVIKLKNMLRSLGSNIPVISKIEMLNAIKNIESICSVSDGIMVARGDLGVECGFASVSAFQKKIIETAISKGKPVIVATQMLDSMIENRRPTQSEICDVANAVFDYADATMLSGETASGKHPELAVKVMRDIINRVDHGKKLPPLHLNLPPSSSQNSSNMIELIARIACEIAERLDIKAIVCLTLTGNMARLVSKFKPSTPIIAFSPRPDVVRKLSLIRGVTGNLNSIFYDTDLAFVQIARYLTEMSFVNEGDLILITGGIPVVQMSPSNTIKLHRVGSSA